MKDARELAGPTLGVVVPCRNEAGVVERKLANLARVSWPVAAGPHRLTIVDDQSDDATFELARAALERHAAAFRERGVECAAIRNVGRPGKPGALAAGLARRAEEPCSLVVLTDADVSLAEDALCALARAFDAPEVALVSGTQRFVATLAEDGSARGAGGTPLVDAGAAFDRWTALVRRAESARGVLFSVHGQLLAWRASLGLAPTPGIAADDIDLMLQVREAYARDAASPWRVELVPGAVFLEVKSTAAQADDQELRRARAYVQVVRAWDGRPPARGLQWAFYRRVPLAAPAATWAALGGLPVLGAALFGATGALGTAAALAALAIAPHGRGWLRLMRRIHDASRLQGAEAPLERWEMARR